MNLGGKRVGNRPEEGITFEFIDAGHVLGSAGVLMRAEGRTVFYTGDVNFDDQTIAQGAKFPEQGIDVLIIETTRGDHPLPEGFTRAAEERRLAEAIAGAFERGGCVLMPVFALGKTQEALAMFYRFRRENLLGEFPIYIGGLSTKMTEIYDKYALTSRRNLPRLQLLEHLEPFVLNGQNIHEAPARAGRIYALSSGMMTPEDAVEHVRAADHQRAEAFDLLRRLCRSQYAGRHSADGEARRSRVARSGGAAAGVALQHRDVPVQRARVA
jgi:Cft2 family RNA processing exonuclease